MHHLCRRQEVGTLAQITLNDGAQHELNFETMLPWAHLEQLYGSLQGAFAAAVAVSKGQLQSPMDVAKFVWAGLLHKNADDMGAPTITIKDITGKLEITEMPTYVQALNEALSAVDIEAQLTQEIAQAP